LRLVKAHQILDRINILFILNRTMNTFGIPSVFLIIYTKRSKKMANKKKKMMAGGKGVKKKMLAGGKGVKKKMLAGGKQVKKMMAGGKTKKGYAAGKTVTKKMMAGGKQVSKPDFLDLDNDGNKTEPMKQAAQGRAKGGAIRKMAGGKQVKKMMAGGGKAKSMAKGGAKGGKKKSKTKVRGAGIAQRGVRPAKMR